MKKIYLKIVVILLVGFCFLSKDAQAYDDKVLAQLTPKELEIYQDGKMTSGEYVTGGLLGTFVGIVVMPAQSNDRTEIYRQLLTLARGGMKIFVVSNETDVPTGLIAVPRHLKCLFQLLPHSLTPLQKSPLLFSFLALYCGQASLFLLDISLAHNLVFMQSHPFHSYLGQ
jgi:hypothetical protein